MGEEQAVTDEKSEKNGISEKIGKTVRHGFEKPVQNGKVAGKEKQKNGNHLYQVIIFQLVKLKLD